MRAAIALVVARARTGVIGARGATPWRLATDMAHFKAVTIGKPVVMGRRTWAAVKRALPKRDNIVVTRDAGFRARGGWSYASLDAALACAQARARATRASEVCVIGGADLFRQTLPYASRIYLTDVHADVPGDAIMAAPDPHDWREVSARDAPAGPNDDHAMTFRILERRPIGGL
jgi:dihydrofolate reductase